MMKELNPFATWGIPLLAALVTCLILLRTLTQSSMRRWVMALTGAVAISPTIIPGCPGIDVRPPWCWFLFLDLTDVPGLVVAVGCWILPPVLVVTVGLWGILEIASKTAARKGAA